DVGVSSRISNRASVDLPQPDSPTMPSVSPRRSSKLTPSTARTAPICRCQTMPWVMGKCFTRLSTRRIVSPRTLVDSDAAIADLLGEVAAAGPVAAELPLGRDDVDADLLGVRAARVE